MKEKVRWTDFEELSIAKTFVDLRLAFPFAVANQLMQKAIHKTLPENRWRTLQGPSQAPGVVKKVSPLWEERVTALALAAKPEPLIIHVEVPVPLDYSKLYEQLDGPTLAAFAVGKLQQVLNGLTLAKGETPTSSSVLPTAPVLSIIKAASPAPRKPRVAIVALPGQHSDIKEKLNGVNDRLDIRYLDAERQSNSFTTVDYAVILSATSHANWNNAKNSLPSSRVFFVEGISRAVQKVMDINSLTK